MWEAKAKLSVVIPALNEEHGLGEVLREIPTVELSRMGYETELVVVDNGSVDFTPIVALLHGATVVVEPQRGYGNAYKAGFAYATGDVVATGDADLTYPFSALPEILTRMEERKLDFVTTDRLSRLESGVMCRSHVFGNWLLSLTAKILFRLPFRDSQSGMWVFRRSIWDALDVTSSGMPFSQELKIEAFVRGYRCEEFPITYRARAGKAKLNTISDGIGNITQMVRKRLAIDAQASRSQVLTTSELNSTDVRACHSTPKEADSGPQSEICIAWDERWFDPADDLDVVASATRTDTPGAHTLLIDIEEADQTRRMVVWRPKPAARWPNAPLSERVAADA